MIAELMMMLFKLFSTLLAGLGLNILSPLSSTATSDEPNPPYVEDGYPIVIIGSGLAGHAAAAELSSMMSKDASLAATFGDRKILVLEKEEKFGGNSMKATSGINGALSDFQQAQGIRDNLHSFTHDVTVSATSKQTDEPLASSRKALIIQLVRDSRHAINWLQNEFDLDLSKIAQLGGHSTPRTHRPPKGPAGNIIVKTIHTALETRPNIEFLYNHKVVELVVDEESKSIIGVKVESPSPDAPDTMETDTILAAAVILASGGFGNDHTSSGLLDEFSREGEESLPTTNGAWATGDGVKLGRAIGARLIDMSEIQVHPTGFVNPKDPEAMTKFLAPEALRGSGGIMLNCQGQRFVNELDLRRTVVEAMRQQQKQEFYLLLNEEAAQIFGPNMGFYQKFGLFEKYENAGEFEKFLKDKNEDEQIGDVANVLRVYSDIAKSGVVDEFGKQVFPVKKFDGSEALFVAQVTPVIHYTMGGLEIDKNARVLGQDGEVMHGLYGAGEVTGGLHGKNRLAGNSLLECVVYGRVAAKSVVQYVQQARENKMIRPAKTEL